MRFALDYETFQRVKVTERVSFPVTLNLNDYMKGYEGIETKLYDKEVEKILDEKLRHVTITREIIKQNNPGFKMPLS